MSTYGIIYCTYNSEDYVSPTLAPWIEARKTHLGGHTFVICAISYPFKGFDAGPRDKTQDLLRAHKAVGDIDGLLIGPNPISETEARGNALRWLKAEGVEATWMVDGDEFYTVEQIAAIASFTESQPFSVWFRVALKNAVFTVDQHLVEPFTPPRIHRVKTGSYEAHSFCQDNDVLYGGTITRDLVPQDQFSSMQVPQSLAWVHHRSWLSDERSRLKIDYQLRGRGWPSCSFAWDDSKGGLVFNEAHYARLGQPLPEVAMD